MKELLTFKGHAVSVNQWKDVRVVKKGNRHIPIVYLTNQYREFKNKLIGIIEKEIKIADFFDIYIVVFLKFGQDSDSVVKPLLDSITAAETIEDDKYCRNIVIERHYHANKGNDLVAVYIEPLSIEDVKTAHKEMDNVF